MATLQIMLCPSCQINESIHDPSYGYLNCAQCRDTQAQIAKPKMIIELTTDEIKEDRKRYKSDIRQPFRQGKLSKEYADEHPETIKNMLKEGNLTEEEIKSAQNVWNEDSFYES